MIKPCTPCSLEDTQGDGEILTEGKSYRFSEMRVREYACVKYLSCLRVQKQQKLNLHFLGYTLAVTLTEAVASSIQQPPAQQHLAPSFDYVYPIHLPVVGVEHFNSEAMESFWNAIKVRFECVAV